MPAHSSSCVPSCGQPSDQVLVLEMTLKECLISSYVLYRGQADTGLNFNDTVDEKKRIPVRKYLFNSIDVQNRHWFTSGTLRVSSTTLNHFEVAPAPVPLD